MNERVRERLAYLNGREFRKIRKDEELNLTEEVRDLSLAMKKARVFEITIDREEPVFLGEDDIYGFNRLHKRLPSCNLAPDYVGKWGPAGLSAYYANITIDYAKALKYGLNGLLKMAKDNYDKVDDEGREFFDAFEVCVKACERLVVKYREKAKEMGNNTLYEALKVVPMDGAQDYYQATVVMHFLQYILRLDKHNHMTLGRYDQYMKPYFEASVKNGATYDEILEITEMFFISMNLDTDIYGGVQQGDNGQSLVLGGCDEDGNDAFNDLSEICLQASEDLKVIDPKINLRVNKNTPLSLYERGTRLTKQGLGFPQYSNDDIVIPGLVKLGYDIKDARNYAVAACWEFIISGCGADYPNIGVMNFPLAVERATKKLESCKDFEEFKALVKEEIEFIANEQMEMYNQGVYMPDPLLSAFVSPCLETGIDIGRGGAKYNNFGIHGTGIANAADAMEAINEKVFIKKEITAKELITALDANFEGHEDLRRKLADCPKMGNNIESVDDKAAYVMKCFADAVNNKPNHRGGVYRAGTGSAMEYLWSASKVGATADGRRAKEAYGSSYSPALTTRLNGPLSAVQSFAKQDLVNLCNGGPFTIEIHDTVFRNEEGEKKVAMLVKSFIDLGGHQIQINAINRDTLLDAQAHPEKYPNLIVRVWGWSGYFNELDIDYQNHVIRRTEFTF